MKDYLINGLAIKTNWWNTLIKLFGLVPQKSQFQTFTYFLPCPPHRKTGYREKQFDRIMKEILGHGYKIINFKTQQISRDGMSGMWLVFILKSHPRTLSLESILNSFENDEKHIDLP